MSHCVSPSLKRFLTVVAAVIVLSSICAADLTIGSGNTATAYPTVPRPSTTPCVVQLFQNVDFADFSPKTFTYAPPTSCPGPWAKVVFEADFSVDAGRQFDRTANVWLGGTNLYFGTTAEPSHDVARSWHVERDLTDYSALFTTTQSGEVDLGNLVNSTYTSVLHGSADLAFYPPDPVAPASADVVLPMAAGANGETVALFSSTDLLAQTFTLPSNVESAYLDVFAQSQSNDEFWWTCAPNDVAGELFNCGNTAYREGEVSIDGQPAGIVPIYPWIYTGGIDPYLWRPIPGVQTLNFVPYRVNLTPFAALLSDGQPHQVALSVFNADSYFSATATLLLYLDHGSTQVTGGVTLNTLSGVPSPMVVENLSTNNQGVIRGGVKVSSQRTYRINGFANTSHGRVETDVYKAVYFSNQQGYLVPPAGLPFVQDVNQDTRIVSMTRTSTLGGDTRTAARELAWPVILNFSQALNPDGSVSQTTTLTQAYESAEQDTVNGAASFSRVISDVVTPADTLVFHSDGSVTNQNQSNAQEYFIQDSTGYCFSRSIAASGGVLTSVTNGVGCSK